MNYKGGGGEVNLGHCQRIHSQLLVNTSSFASEDLFAKFAGLESQKSQKGSENLEKETNSQISENDETEYDFPIVHHIFVLSDLAYRLIEFPKSKIPADRDSMRILNQALVVDTILFLLHGPRCYLYGSRYENDLSKPIRDTDTGT